MKTLLLIISLAPLGVVGAAVGAAVVDAAGGGVGTPVHTSGFSPYQSNLC